MRPARCIPVLLGALTCALGTLGYCQSPQADAGRAALQETQRAAAVAQSTAAKLRATDPEAYFATQREQSKRDTAVALRYRDLPEAAYVFRDVRNRNRQLAIQARFARKNPRAAIELYEEAIVAESNMPELERISTLRFEAGIADTLRFDH